jgi:hypothetical protein
MRRLRGMQLDLYTYLDQSSAELRGLVFGEVITRQVDSNGLRRK